MENWLAAIFMPAKLAFFSNMLILNEHVLSKAEGS